jgi:hypothetical protein
LRWGVSGALFVTGGGFWPFALIWVGAVAVLLATRSMFAHMRIAWLAVLAVGVLACLLLAFEGGLFVLPAAVVFAFAEAIGGGQRPSVVR